MEPGRIGVIFDCDGTLLDSMDVWREVEDELARRAGATLPDADKDELMLDYYRNRAHERSGALAFVSALVERGVRVSVASSSPQKYLQAGLERAGFSPYVSLIVSVDDVASSKREPKVYDHARRLMDTPLDTTWGFEDSAYALRTLRDAGYRTVGIYDRDDAGTHEELRANADVVIDSFEELDAETFISWNEGR